MSCWKISCVLRVSVTTTTGWAGKRRAMSTAKNGWAAGLTEEKDNDSPCSNRPRTDCTTGTDATTEKGSPVVNSDRLLTKS